MIVRINQRMAFVGLLALGLIGMASARSSAQVINPGFEANPDFANWTVIGAASIVTSAYGVGPTEGKQEALLTNDTTTGAVGVSALESALGYSSGTLTGLGKGTVTNGSAIVSDAFTATAGQTLTFDWDFLTNELDPTLNLSHNDFAFWSITSSSPSVLADVSTGLFLTPLNLSPSLDFLDDTGYLTGPAVPFVIPTTGSYKLIFGVVNVGVSDTPSGLLVDNINLITLRTTPNGTPEPGSLAMVIALGSTGVFAVARRNRKRN